MREILFRGKANSKNPKYAYYNSWIYGDLMTNRDIMFIHPKVNIFHIEHYLAKMVVSHRVDPKTVGQFTGLTDKNGNKIFEGDVLEYINTDDKPHRVKVIFEDGAFLINDDGIVDYDLITSYFCLGFRVVGNIHDNPELLGGV